jgi:hypothetical protein
MSSPDGTKWLVAVVDGVFSEGNTKNSRSVKLKDPSTQQSRQYFFANDKDIVEIQSLPADFSSFIVGRHVVKDGNLYVLNRVDPLFWLLGLYSPTQEHKQWQPFDQVVESLPPEVRKSMVGKQIPHLCQVLSTDQTGDVPYYKFKAEKALRWLQLKEERVYQCLLRQNLAKQNLEKEKVVKTGRRGGAVSASFNMLDDPMAAAPAEDYNAVCDSKKLKIDSIQIVCSYISDEWSKEFIQSLGMDEETVLEANSAKKVKPSYHSTKYAKVVEDTPKERTKAKKVEESRTMGNKRLAKVNTKGMKSLSNFFGAPKKKSKTQ